jgi:TolB-like protein
MICSTSSSIDAAIPRAVLVVLLVSGCALLDRAAGPKLEVESLEPDRPGPGTVGSTAIRWTASATGGSGELSYEFRTQRGSLEVIEQTGSGSTWDWIPETAGTFRVEVTVSDASGASVGSGWSSPYVVLPDATRYTLIAVLPIENLSGTRSHSRAVLQRLRSRLELNGLRLVDEEILDTFMHRERIRAASGLSREESRAIKEATGAGAVLITSITAYREAPPLEVSMFARLVSTGDQPEIIWMNSIGLTGEDAVGLLGIGRVTDAGVLLEKVIQRLTGALTRYLPEAAPRVPFPDARPTDGFRAGDARSPDFEDAIDPRLQTGADPCDPQSSEGADSPAGSGACRNGDAASRVLSAYERESDESSLPRDPGAKYAPRSVFRSRLAGSRRRYSVAVLPFVNESERKNAGKIMTLHFVEELARVDGLRVVDPGLVRHEMLRYRTIIPEGPSLSTADLLSSAGSLGIDLILSGTVFDYGSGLGGLRVEFGLDIIDTADREVVWTSRSYNQGSEGVFFLDVGRVYTPHRMAAEMARAAVRQLRD